MTRAKAQRKKKTPNLASWGEQIPVIMLYGEPEKFA
jgi:hypothetical protein